MNKKDWKTIKHVQIRLFDEVGPVYSFPIHCPRWLFWLLEKLEIR